MSTGVYHLVILIWMQSLQNTNLLPLNTLTRYSHCTQKDLDEKSLDQYDKWFLLRREEFGALPV